MSWFPGTYPFGTTSYLPLDEHEPCKKQLDVVNNDRMALQAHLARALRDSEKTLAERKKLKQDHDALNKSHGSLEEEVKKLSATVADLRENSVPRQDYLEAVSDVQSNGNRAAAHEMTAKSHAATIKKLEKEVAGLKAKANAAAHTEQQLRTRIADSRSEQERVIAKLRKEAKDLETTLTMAHEVKEKIRESTAAKVNDADQKLQAAQRSLVERAAQWHREKLDFIRESKALKEQIDELKSTSPTEVQQLRLKNAALSKAQEDARNLLDKSAQECIRLAAQREEKARMCEKLGQEILQQRDAQEKLRQQYLQQTELLAIAKDENERLLASWNAAKKNHENDKEDYEDHLGYLIRQVDYQEGECIALEGKLETAQKEHNDLKAEYAKARETIASTKAANDEMKKRCDDLQKRLYATLVELDKTRELHRVLAASSVAKCQIIDEIKGSRAKEAQKNKKLEEEIELIKGSLAEAKAETDQLNTRYTTLYEEYQDTRKEHTLSLVELQNERNKGRVLEARLEMQKAGYKEQLERLGKHCEELTIENEELTRALEGFEHVGEDEYEDECTWPPENTSMEGLIVEASNEEAE